MFGFPVVIGNYHRQYLQEICAQFHACISVFVSAVNFHEMYKSAEQEAAEMDAKDGLPKVDSV